MKWNIKKRTEPELLNLFPNGRVLLCVEVIIRRNHIHRSKANLNDCNEEEEEKNTWEDIWSKVYKVNTFYILVLSIFIVLAFSLFIQPTTGIKSLRNGVPTSFCLNKVSLKLKLVHGANRSEDAITESISFESLTTGKYITKISPERSTLVNSWRVVSMAFRELPTTKLALSVTDWTFSVPRT